MDRKEKTMLYKGGVARAQLCEELGLAKENIQDIDVLDSLDDDWNVQQEREKHDSLLEAYFASRDCNLNEVIVMDGKVHASHDAVRGFLDGIVVVKEEGERAFFRGLRFAARFGFRVKTEVSLKMVNSTNEFIHQWTKAIEEGPEVEKVFLDLARTYGYELTKEDSPLWGKKSHFDRPWERIFDELDFFYLWAEEVEIGLST